MPYPGWFIKYYGTRVLRARVILASENMLRVSPISLERVRDALTQAGYVNVKGNRWESYPRLRQHWARRHARRFYPRRGC